MSDYISREDALNFELSIETDPETIQAVVQGMQLYAEYLKQIPAADVVEVRHGTWTEKFVDDFTTEINPFMRRRFYCSVCGEWNTHGKSRYCLKCGAKMDGGNPDA